MRNNANTELGWPVAAFLIAIAVFGIVLIGHAPKWPIYAACTNLRTWPLTDTKSPDTGRAIH
jgi:hypothetical protein